MTLLLLLALALIPAPLWAQVSALRVEGGREPVSVAVASHRGYPAYPAATLGALGAEVEADPRGARAVLFGDTLVFEALSPYFLAAGRVQQAVAPAYREGGSLYLPHQFFSEWLPARYPARVVYRDGTLRLLAPPPTPDAAKVGEGEGEREGKGTPSPSRPPSPSRAASGGAEKKAAVPRVVIIDAGHGGRDPGKIGPNRLREKDVALAVAKRLARALRERSGYEVHLTRATDTLIALAERPRLANHWKGGRPAALFLSIHANSGPARADGFETFFLSEARTDDERRVAEMENAAVAYEEEQSGAPTDALDRILNTLRNDFYLRASNDLAEVIQRRVDSVHPGPNRGVKQAGFHVLVGAFMPAVLVEVGFISNRREATLLGSADFQARMARALADAVDQFFSSHEHLWLAEGER